MLLEVYGPDDEGTNELSAFNTKDETIRWVLLTLLLLVLLRLDFRPLLWAVMEPPLRRMLLLPGRGTEEHNEATAVDCHEEDERDADNDEGADKDAVSPSNMDRACLATREHIRHTG